MHERVSSDFVSLSRSRSVGQCRLVGVGWSVSVGRSVGRSVGWSVSVGRCRLVGVGWSVGWSVSRLVGQSVVNLEMIAPNRHEHTNWMTI